MAQLSDESLMPWGKYSKPPDGPLKMVDVPASYLLWCYENGKCNGSVKEYIEDNYDVLKEEIKRASQTKR